MPYESWKWKEVVRRKFQYNWFLPKTRSFFNRIVSEQRTCFQVKGGFGNELLVAIGNILN